MAELGSIKGFLASELYAFVWVFLLGLYLAYAAASLVAGEIERDRMELLLALPISRARLVVEGDAGLYGSTEALIDISRGRQRQILSIVLSTRIVGAAVLTVGALALLAGSVAWFSRRDVP